MMRESGNCGNGKLMNYINDELQQLSLDETESSEPNKYFLPPYMDYLKKRVATPNATVVKGSCLTHSTIT
eukprot:Seg5878.4 transcript_id=Seg5878.4/GoldUCD/mRNA.D3Y31 product="hypothetical protein" pseudo=true protein_id=Seg5878.4/GoldUCD/D3Y31